MRKAKEWEESDGLDKLRKYCAWQERCRSEAWSKLSLLGCPRSDIDRLLDTLEDEGFLDDARYARSYARGKHRQKGWGKVKIREALRGKRLPERLIDEALELLEPEDYAEMALAQARKYAGGAAPADWESEQKLWQQLERKGYEGPIIERALKELKSE